MSSTPREPSAAAMQLLLDANANGRIDIPCGSAEEIENYLRRLLSLEKAGYVIRSRGEAFFRPFILTERGSSWKNQQLKNDTRNLREPEAA